ncbi:hypothetical protein CN566_26915 [Bacillus wiedmannii]|nr:hypothetical protein CN566_26915 [Bacillus wiedmannii]
MKWPEILAACSALTAKVLSCTKSRPPIFIYFRKKPALHSEFHLSLFCRYCMTMTTTWFIRF